MLNAWERRTLKALDAHYDSERIFRRSNSLIGIPSVASGVVISALSFYFIGKQVSIWAQLTVGFLGLIQVVLATLHTWLRHNELADKHHMAGNNYAAIRRHIEQLITQPTKITEDSVSEIRKRIDELSKEAPTIPGRVWRKTQIAYRGHGTADGRILPTDER